MKSDNLHMNTCTHRLCPQNCLEIFLTLQAGYEADLKRLARPKTGLAHRAAQRFRAVYGDGVDSDESDEGPSMNVYLAMSGLYTSTPVVSCTYTYMHTKKYIYIYSLYYIHIPVHIMCVGRMNS